MADLLSMNKLSCYCKQPCTLKCTKNDVLRELAVDNIRGQKNSWSFVAQMNENILLALTMLTV